MRRQFCFNFVVSGFAVANAWDKLKKLAVQDILGQIRSCSICKGHLPDLPRPILQAGSRAKILIIGQAPGRIVHQSGIPWQDKSGDELRRWLGASKEQFYDPALFGLMPMGFCYPGKGKSGDLPPRPECAPEWHAKLLAGMREIRLTFLIGQYSQKYYLGDRLKENLTETVRAFREYLPEYFPLIHPSPRNGIWKKRNPWFEEDVVPEIRKKVGPLL